MNLLKRTHVFFLMSIFLLAAGSAANSAPAVKVGIVPAPPFAMKQSGGEWEGISVDLWRAVAGKMGITCEYHECNYAELIKKISEGTLEAGIGRLSALEMHNPNIDWTHAFYFSGLAIAVPKMTERQHWLAVLRMLRASNFFLLLSMILLILFVAGVSIWLLEHRHNPEHFSKNPIKGIGAGLWWSAATITTVGYGDKAPVTFSGRLLAFFWMLVGIVLVSVFTATITSMCTVSRLGNVYEHPADLQNKRLCAVAGSPAEMFLQKIGADYQQTATTLEALKLLSGDNVDMVVDDQSALKYYSRRNKISRATILPHLLTLEGYSFVLAKNSPLRDQLNQAIKEYTSLPNWQNILSKYLGN